MFPTLRKKRIRVAVRRDVERLRSAGAVEQHRVVVAELTLDAVAAVAGIPDERVVAEAHEGGVVAAVAVGAIMAEAAAEHFPAGAAGERVVAELAVERRRLRVGEDAVDLVDPDEVVAEPGLDLDLVEPVAVEPALGRAVVVDVELERVGVAGPEPKRDRVAPERALDLERVVFDLRLDLLLVLHRRRGARLGREAEAERGDGGDDERPER